MNKILSFFDLSAGKRYFHYFIFENIKSTSLHIIFGNDIDESNENSFFIIDADVVLISVSMLIVAGKPAGRNILLSTCGFIPIFRYIPIFITTTNDFHIAGLFRSLFWIISKSLEDCKDFWLMLWLFLEIHII